MYHGRVRRIQIHIEEDLDQAATAEAARRGMSKAALIRECVARSLSPRPREDAWDALIGWLDDEPVEEIDDVLYGPTS